MATNADPFEPTGPQPGSEWYAMSPEQRDMVQAQFGPGSFYMAEGNAVYSPSQQIYIPVEPNAPWMQDPVRTRENRDDWSSRIGNLMPLGFMAGLGGMTFGGAGAGGGSTGAGPFTGGLKVSPEAAAAMGTGGGASVPASGLSAGSGASQVLGVGGGSAIPVAGLNLSPGAMAAFNAGINLPFAASSGVLSGGEGVAFGGQPAGAGSTGVPQPGGLRVGPNAANQMGIPAQAPPGAGPSAPAATGAGPTTATSGGGAVATTGAGAGVVENILGQMKNNAVALGLMGASMLAAGKPAELPSQEQLQGLSADAQATAQQLLAQYRAGQLSASQQAGLDQLTKQTKNQITQYFSSIGQADSTAHMQALAQVDQQALGMRQQMLDSMLQQGLQAIGVASGPLNTIAQYQLGQDQALRNAFGQFAQSVGLLFGRNAGTPSTPQPQPRAPSPPPSVTSQSQPEFLPAG